MEDIKIVWSAIFPLKIWQHELEMELELLSEPREGASLITHWKKGERIH